MTEKKIVSFKFWFGSHNAGEVSYSEMLEDVVQTGHLDFQAPSVFVS